MSASDLREARADLLKRAINCPHAITDEAVTLYFDPKKPGHNALNQLGNRLDAAQAQCADERREDFEAWHLKKYGYTPTRVAQMNGLYKTHTSRVAWEGWIAAIAATKGENDAE